MANIVNAERVSLAFGTRILLDEVSCGLSDGDVVGVVGRNGDGKTTLLRLLVGSFEPDSGQIVRNSSASIGHLGQEESFAVGATVRDTVIGGQADHVWAADSASRSVVHQLLGGIDLAKPVSELSGGERRRVGLATVLLAGHDLLVLDEPTNHLDVEAVAWLAGHLNHLQSGGTAMLVVSHDRWFLDAVCNRVWEVHDAAVDAYDGGYAAYVLARAERTRQAVANESRRQNLLRKELAWLRRGPPARTSKPKFRIDAANALISDVPEARDSVKLREFAVSRLGKDVFDLHQVSYAVDDRTLLDHLDWSIGPGDRIGIIGVNGAGKTTLLRLLTGEAQPQSGKVKQGKTLRLGHLSQTVVELDESERVLESVQRLQRQVTLATGVESSTSNLLEDFGFRGERLVTRIGELSGGERRRLQFLRLLLNEPNVLLLDEPTNDLDIDTLTVIEDYLDTWPGTLIVVSHDRWFLERTCDVSYALLGDGSCVLLPGGVEEYLERRRAAKATKTPAPAEGARAGASDAARQRQARKDLARVETQLAKIENQITRLHGMLNDHAADYAKLVSLGAELDQAQARRDELEAQWLELAETVEPN
ncbi:MAG: ABC-F family ATP-binding cassette domain-containing protein [Propionicimonas sp.]|uniref:ABC-F family ATP-binding cassette domain-containing protein n=1 Tax=Propionicimonas sp. TaxID=1955623 RepID=UPI001DB1358C|nr:ABC-F family ATP-binding cassette domain-containing protein [Propionicimonas sp.]MBU4206054.1 ABC-F family ATP-binding cassette domain-containing protein [Actinomycetota bacterium]MBU4249324.1 ABC-F family ATP-binding cassette domain-containing protein [Actinomycetota bacterium]MBU4363883.1 ABC-F family ATP-binding cassette domain-containing protein [Actinomycetota bacterium]MBU4417340.1 ABC-F family ATP-binding cassette domain-containing protein [Actinomycetota bacterium]MCG2805530.1 ABC-F